MKWWHWAAAGGGALIILGIVGSVLLAYRHPQSALGAPASRCELPGTQAYVEAEGVWIQDYDDENRSTFIRAEARIILIQFRDGVGKWESTFP